MEQVTSASRTALVTRCHMFPGIKEKVGPSDRLSLCQEQAVGPSQPWEQRWQPDAASTGELVAWEWQKWVSSKAGFSLRAAGAHTEVSEKKPRFAHPAKGSWVWSDGNT